MKHCKQFVSRMPKFALKNRLLQLRVITLIFLLLCFKAIFHFVITYGVYNYPHMPPEVIESQLFQKITPQVTLQKSKPDCDYDDILQSNKSLHKWVVPKRDEFSFKVLENGSYAPEHCNPRYSVALLVTYRNRQRQLDTFLVYMHTFLRKQNIHYRIYLIEQQDAKPFNKGVLYNIGAQQAIRDNFPCLILHDVDLLPLDESNLYVCTMDPRHMSASIDKYRFVMPYDYLAGGVLAIKADQFMAVDGLSNRFEGWGGEDFYARIIAHKFDVIRFPPTMSKYTMLVHPQKPKNVKRKVIMKENRQRLNDKDGLSTLPHCRIHVRGHRLYTLIGVKL